MVDDEKKEADSVIIGSPIKDITPPKPVIGDNGGGHDRATSALNDKATGQMLNQLQDLLVSSPHTVLSPPPTHK
jgi:hypothetical protein